MTPVLAVALVGCAPVSNLVSAAATLRPDSQRGQTVRLMKLWLIQVAVALIGLIGLLAFYKLADVDTNIDMGNGTAIGLAMLALLWLVVACLGTGVTFCLRLFRRRR